MKHVSIHVQTLHWLIINRMDVLYLKLSSCFVQWRLAIHIIYYFYESYVQSVALTNSR